MTTHDVTADRHRTNHLPGPDTALRARITIVALALAAGAAAVITVLAWKPWPGRDDFAYADLAPVRDAAWAGAVIDGIGFAVGGVALGLAVCLLAPSRGSVWATAGAVAGSLGGITFCGGIVSLGVLEWYATAPAIPAQAGTALLDQVSGDPTHLMAVQAIGFVLHSLGVLLLAVALWRSRSVPRWLPASVGLLTVAAFAGFDGRALDLVEAARAVALILVAWYLWRTTRQPAVTG